ncbi:tetratricopeptide repeat protein [Sphingomonadaceae bacterium]|nr:tetratricopeptide repeat protein [Sphingomonadaceae bacterium]
MTWLVVIGLAAVMFLIAAFVLKMPKPGYSLFGAALMVGLAGYAMQGSPSLSGAPKEATSDVSGTGAAMVESRRSLFDTAVLPSRFVVSADAFTRRGQNDDAAGFLLNAVTENPQDTEAWLALGNALTEHADGQLTPAALYAYSKAEQTDPEHPGAAYFLGVGMIRSGRPAEALQLWQELAARAPDDAPWKPVIEERAASLGEMMMRMRSGAAQPGMPAPAPQTPPAPPAGP